jgi:4-hydroxybenzoate polyprenyltransferase
MQDMSAVKNYLSLIKFSHTIFALPFALIGFFIGVISLPSPGASSGDLNGPVSGVQKILDYFSAHWLIFILVILCMIFARSAAMAFNRYLDRHFDAKNPRTAIREIPAGIIPANNALFFTVAMSLLFMATTWFINPLCFYLSPVALAVVLGYSYTKRFTPLCHLVLGVGLSLAPIGAYLAVTGQFSPLPVFFSFAVVFWVSGFDIIYALQDEEFDQKNELYSIPSWLGKTKALRVSELLHILSAGFVILAGWYGGFGAWYWIGLFIFTGMLIYQHTVVSPTDLSRVNLAFMTANGIASVVFACFTITDLFMR